jgi:D-alanine-D-alanine ligase
MRASGGHDKRIHGQVVVVHHACRLSPPLPSAAMSSSQRVRVAVVFGGQSSEHAISCVSAASILRALDRSVYDVRPIGISRDGRWLTQADDADRLMISGDSLPEIDPSGDLVVPARDVDRASLSDVDVVFPVLHGPFGEDGTVQGLLELAGVPYVGSGVLASAAAMDKVHFKSVMRAHGIPVVDYEFISSHDWIADRDRCLSRIERLGLPVFVKPSRAGSSVGITKVHSHDDVTSAIEQARAHDPRVLVEIGIAGVREIEVGVMTDESGRVISSVCGEVVVREGHEFYDFAAKYLDDAADLYAPADLDVSLAERIRSMACAAFIALGCEGLARVDFFVDRDQNVVINEVNTMPGFTSISMFPRMWQATGMTYPELVDHLIRDALRRGTGLR